MDHSSVDCRFSDLNGSSSELKTPASKKIIHLQSLACRKFWWNCDNKLSICIVLVQSKECSWKGWNLALFSIREIIRQGCAARCCDDNTSENYFDKQLQTNAKRCRSYNRKQEELNELKSPENVEEEKQLKKKCSFPRRKKISEMTPEQIHVKREYNIKMAGKSSKF